MQVRRAILEHMVNIAHFILGHIIDRSYESIQEYIRITQMDQPSSYGTHVEMFTLAHLLDTPIFSYDTRYNDWAKYDSSSVDRRLVFDNTQMAMYIRLHAEHFEVVHSVRKK